MLSAISLYTGQSTHQHLLCAAMLTQKTPYPTILVVVPYAIIVKTPYPTILVVVSYASNVSDTSRAHSLQHAQRQPVLFSAMWTTSRIEDRIRMHNEAFGAFAYLNHSLHQCRLPATGN